MVSVQRTRPPDSRHHFRNPWSRIDLLSGRNSAFDSVDGMDRGPTIFDAMFQPSIFHRPSVLFDGIRRGRRGRYELLEESSALNDTSRTSLFSPSHQRGWDPEITDFSSNSNVRIIPIRVEHGPKQDVSARTPTRRNNSFNTLTENGSKSRPIRLDSDSSKELISSNNKPPRLPLIERDDVEVICVDEKNTSSLDQPEHLKTDRLGLSVKKGFNFSNNISSKPDENRFRKRGSEESADCLCLDDVDIKVGTDLDSPSSRKDLRDCAVTEKVNCDEEKEVNPSPSYPVYKVLKDKLAAESRQVDYIRGDGNCFFRAVSKQIYGSERYHRVFRSLIVDLIATNRSKFAQFIDGENVQKHIEQLGQESSWATTCEIYAAATLLQRDIYMLTPDPLKETYSWLLFKPIFKLTDQVSSVSSHPCYITLCNTNGNHYDRIVADHGGCNCFLPKPEMDGISCTVDLTL